MPRYTPSSDEMDESYAGSKPDVNPPEESPPEKSPEQSVDEENASSNEILVPKKNLHEGIKVGDECKFKATADFGEEMAFEYVKEDKETPGDEGETSNMSVEGRELAEMDAKGT